MNKNFKDLSGKRFGMLTVTSEHESRRGTTGHTHTYWKCVCDCGRELWVRGTGLTYGTTKTCNHHNQCNLIHGKTNTRLYRIYHDMKQRCTNSNSKCFKDYGGRGIKICDEWIGEKGFINFYEWAVANGYKDDLSIDRINVNGNYEPSNCRWADSYTQMKNRRNSIYIHDDGKPKYLIDAVEDHGVSYSAVRGRMGIGWDESELLVQPPEERKVFYQGSYYSLKELSEITNISYSTLQSRFTKNFTDEEIVKPLLSTNKRPVCQYSLDGKLIAEYDGIADASRETGVRQNNISMCCAHTRHKAGGFRWEYKEVDKPQREERCLRRKPDGGWINNKKQS